MRSAENTLVLLKPDALDRGLCGEALARFERAGLRVAHARDVRLTRSLLSRHYAELRRKNRPAYERNLPYLAGRRVLALILTGPNAVAKTRALVGPTDPLTAPAGTIRGDFSSDSVALADAASRGLHNLVHASDSVASAAREVRLWFPGR